MNKYAELMREAAEYIDSCTPDNHPVPPVYHELMQAAHDIEPQEPVAEVQEHPCDHKSTWLVKTVPPENFYVGMKLYAHPQPAERQPAPDYTFTEAMKVCEEGLREWREKPHNKRWWKRIDGTPIPNDLLCCIAEALAAHRKGSES